VPPLTDINGSEVQFPENLNPQETKAYLKTCIYDKYLTDGAGKND
jgi:hypothetical protein